MEDNMDNRTLRRRQVAWLRSNIISRASDGQKLDPEDVAALPAQFRAEVETYAQHCASLHREGDRGLAQTAARDLIGGIAAKLPADWEPPSSGGPDPAVLAEIGRR